MLWENLIEIGFSCSLFANALLFIPQALKIFRTKTAQGVSITTFLGFNTIQLFIILHGYLYKDYLLMFGTLLSFITCGTVAVLIIIYNRNPDKQPAG